VNALGADWFSRPLPSDYLKELWKSVERSELSAEDFALRQAALVLEYRRLWESALLLPGFSDLKESLLFELGQFTGNTDLGDVERKCRQAAQQVEREWQQNVNPADQHAVERFYELEDGIFGNLWWHTLCEDDSPLAYVTALHFATQRKCHRYLDFGSGVGSGGIVFARHGFDVTLGEISSSRLGFAEWRFKRRGMLANFIDLRTSTLSELAFDVITAMDVFEHLYDPVGTLETLWRALKPKGLLIGRFDAEPDDDRAGHIVHDMRPSVECMNRLGLVEIWRDDWIWGHWVLQKA